MRHSEVAQRKESKLNLPRTGSHLETLREDSRAPTRPKPEMVLYSSKRMWSSVWTVNPIRLVWNSF